MQRKVNYVILVFAGKPCGDVFGTLRVFRDGETKLAPEHEGVEAGALLLARIKSTKRAFNENYSRVRMIYRTLHAAQTEND